MNTKAMRLLWLAPVCLLVSIGGSLLAVWALSSLTGFTFYPSVVAVLSAAVCASAIGISQLRKKSDDRGNAA